MVTEKTINLERGSDLNDSRVYSNANFRPVAPVSRTFRETRETPTSNLILTQETFKVPILPINQLSGSKIYQSQDITHNSPPKVIPAIQLASYTVELSLRE